MKPIKKVIFIFIVIVILAWLISLFAPRSNRIEYGVTFSYPYAESLGLDWQKTYLAILDELKPGRIRLSAYWDKVEGERNKFDFSQLDFQINEAQKRNVKVVLGVGRRLPRWPECHDPVWIKDLSKDVLNTSQLSYVEQVVNHYVNNKTVVAWQVENEPFLSSFGICPPLDLNFYDTEIALVKKLDPVRPIIITDSGELSFWIHSGARGDIFGTTFYRYVYSDKFKRYWTNHIPVLYYRFKAGLLRLLHPGKPIAIMELETEPWTPRGIVNTALDEQFKTMGMDKFSEITGLAADTGFSPQYLWGAEWWYWMKTTQDHPEFWERAKGMFNN